MKAIFYTDGSCKPNPGYGGYGYFGYTFIESKKSTKYPDTNYYFTSKGLNEEKEKIEVVDIYEYIEFIKDITTNNNAELSSIIRVLEKCLSIEVDEITIYTDSNYIASNINTLDIWKKNNWKRIDNKELIHVNEWKIIDNLLTEIKYKNIVINIKWIKGHSDNFGNQLADFYSVIASNAAFINKDNKEANNVIFDSVMSFKEFISSFYDKDVILNFKDMFYNPFIKNTTFHFLTNFEKRNIDIGKKNAESIFAINVGFIPDYITKIKQFIDSFKIKENFYCIKISRLKNSYCLRLFKYIDLKYLIVRNKTGYKIVADEGDIIYHMDFKFPLIMDIFKTFDFLVNDYIDKHNTITLDITDLILDKKSLKIKNSDEYIVLPNIDGLHFLSRPKLEIGKDIPSYLILNSIKKDIKKVEVAISVCYETNIASIYTVFKLSNRELITCHVLNKFLLAKLSLN